MHSEARRSQNKQANKQLYYSLNLIAVYKCTTIIGETEDRIGIWRCWFLRRGENRSIRRKTSRSKDKNQQQTQPTYGTGTGRQVLSSLRHPCSPVTSIFIKYQSNTVADPIWRQTTVLNARARQEPESTKVRTL